MPIPRAYFRYNQIRYVLPIAFEERYIICSSCTAILEETGRTCLPMKQSLLGRQEDGAGIEDEGRITSYLGVSDCKNLIGSDHEIRRFAVTGIPSACW